MVTQLQDGNTPYLAATSLDPRPTVLVLDSNVGRLSVYDEIRRLLPGLHYIRAFDNAAFPYGRKSEEFIVECAAEIVIAVQQRYPLSLTVIAYSTASTVPLPALREKFALPVVGVVPAIKPVTRPAASGVVGLLVTRMTVRWSYTHELAARFANECQVAMLGSAELVELAEAKLHGETASLEELQRVLRPWLRTSESPDTIVLGCTHFPLLQEELLQILPEGTRLMGSGTTIAHRTAWLLEYEAPGAESTDENVAFCMAITTETEQLLSVLWCCGFKTPGKLSVQVALMKKYALGRLF